MVKLLMQNFYDYTLELSDGQKYAIVFLGCLAVAGIVLGTLVFPFWNFGNFLKSGHNCLGPAQVMIVWGRAQDNSQ